MGIIHLSEPQFQALLDALQNLTDSVDALNTTLINMNLTLVDVKNVITTVNAKLPTGLLNDKLKVSIL